MVYRIIIALVCCLACFVDVRVQEADTLVYDLTRAVYKGMENHRLRVSDIASALCMSEQTLRRRLREATGE